MAATSRWLPSWWNANIRQQNVSAGLDPETGLPRVGSTSKAPSRSKAGTKAPYQTGVMDWAAQTYPEIMPGMSPETGAAARGEGAAGESREDIERAASGLQNFAGYLSRPYGALPSTFPSVAGSARQFLGTGGSAVGQFEANPFVQETLQSVRGRLQSPEAIDAQTAARLKAQAADTILGTSRAAEQQAREEMARRGISDSGLSAALQRQAAQETGRQISASERDIEIQRALANRESEQAIQELAASLTGQIGQTGLGERALEAETRLAELGRGLQAAELGYEPYRLGLEGMRIAAPLEAQAASLIADQPRFVPDLVSERDRQDMIEYLEDAITRETDAEMQALYAELLGMFTQGIIGAVGPKAMSLFS